jgi:hypothetical protein
VGDATVMMKSPRREIEPLPAQAIRLPLAPFYWWLTAWTRGRGLLSMVYMRQRGDRRLPRPPRRSSRFVSA